MKTVEAISELGKPTKEEQKILIKSLQMLHLLEVMRWHKNCQCQDLKHTIGSRKNVGQYEMKFILNVPVTNGTLSLHKSVLKFQYFTIH